MANPNHLRILEQGQTSWNDWRKISAHIKPDLSSSILSNVNLRGVNLSYTILSNADCSNANLCEANLYLANLSKTNFSNANLTNADFSVAGVTGTIFANNDLSLVKGLEKVRHLGPSIIGIDTLLKSNGNIPEAFLRGCGLSDWQIETVKLHQPTLSNEGITNILYRIHDLRAHQAIQIAPLFISYSHADNDFVAELDRYLSQKGIRFWRDIHHATAGRLETQIDRAIRLNPIVLLVLSNHSVKSDWVEHEARLARKMEIETGRDVLCPVTLDDSWKECNWPERLREQIMEYNILDFSNWNNQDSFRQMFIRLIEGLDLFYK
jgi:hypothetical protein